jgi:hypothetical protein
MDGAFNIYQAQETYSKIWWEILKGTDNGRIILKQILRTWDGRTWTGLGGGGVRTRSFVLCERRETCWLANILWWLLQYRCWFVKATMPPSCIKKVVRLETIRLHTHSVTAETEIRVMRRLSAYPGHWWQSSGLYSLSRSHQNCSQLWQVILQLAPSAAAKINWSWPVSVRVCVDIRHIRTHIHIKKSRNFLKF